MNTTDVFRDPKRTERPSDKEIWLQTYALRILIRFRRRRMPLGVTRTNLARLKRDLNAFYDDPIKRLSIEMSY